MRWWPTAVVSVACRPLGPQDFENAQTFPTGPRPQADTHFGAGHGAPLGAWARLPLRGPCKRPSGEPRLQGTQRRAFSGASRAGRVCDGTPSARCCP